VDLSGCGDNKSEHISFGKEDALILKSIILDMKKLLKNFQVIFWGRSLGCNAIL
jgi:hypothetical protein